MNEEEKCRELARLPYLITLDKPLQDDFLEHTKNCEQCLFWTSYALATLEATRTTDRLEQNDGCPSNDTLAILLLSNVRGIISGYQKVPNKNIFSVNLENFGPLYLAKEHLNGDNPTHCPLCRAHYDDLFKKAIRLQKKYEEQILNGEKVKPVVEDKSQIIKAGSFAYNPQKKPN